MTRIFAWLRFAASMAMVYVSIVSTRAGCGGTANPATTAIPNRSPWWVQRHLDKVDEVKRRRAEIHLVLLGDSITQDYELDGPLACVNFKPLWDDLFARRGTLNLGYNSDQTGQMLWRLRHHEVDGLTPDHVVILAGANNLNYIGDDPRVQSAQQVAGGILAVVEEVHARMPFAHVLVLSILPADLSYERRVKTTAVNALVQSQVSSLPYARYLDVSAPFLDGSRVRTELYYDPVLNPGARALHPNPDGQRMMAELVMHALYGK